MAEIENCPACKEKRIHSEEEWKNHKGEGREGIDIRDSKIKQSQPNLQNIPIKSDLDTEIRKKFQFHLPDHIKDMRCENC